MKEALDVFRFTSQPCTEKYAKAEKLNNLSLAYLLSSSRIFLVKCYRETTVHFRKNHFSQNYKVYKLGFLVEAQCMTLLVRGSSFKCYIGRDSESAALYYYTSIYHKPSIRTS